MVRSRNRFSKTRRSRSRSRKFRFMSPRSNSSGSSGSRGCSRQTSKKYVNRPSPPFPGNKCCGQIMVGNNGSMYKSVPNKNGICAWKKV